MNSLHSLRTEWRSEWQMPQNRISICTSRSVGSRRLILVDASGDVSLAAEYAFASYVVGCMYLTLLLVLFLSSVVIHLNHSDAKERAPAQVRTNVDLQTQRLSAPPP